MSRRARNSADVELELPFPVIEERSLPYVPRKLLRGARRELSGIPAARPGSVLVFRHGSRYEAFHETKHLTGAEVPVVDATSVCVVDTRTRQFTVHVPLPSRSPADDFTIRATFRARVTDPERAAEDGAVNMTGYLADYLGQDPRLSKLGGDYSVEQIAKVRDLVVSRIEAYCEFNPIELPGLAVELASASVLTPHELRLHERQKRDERRRQEIDQLRADGEDLSIKRHKAMVNEGPAALTALGLARGETAVNEAIENARDDEQRLQARFAEAFRILQQNGALDYIDIDPTDMVNAYLEKLTGQPVSRANRGGLRGRDGEGRDAIGPGGENEDDAPPDEADLDE